MISEEGEASRTFFWTKEKALAILFVWVMQVVFGGIFYSFAQYFSLMKDSFSNSTYSYIGFVGTSLAGISNFVGPTSAWLVLNHGYLVVVMVSAVVFALGLILTSYDNMQWELFFTYSVIVGVSLGIMNHLSMAFLTDSFSSREELSYGMAISNTGTGIGLIMVSCIIAYYCNVHEYETWEVIFRYLSLLSVVIVAAAAFVVAQAPEDLTKTHANDRREIEVVLGEQRLETQPLVDDPNKKDCDLSGIDLLFSSDKRALYLFISNVVGLSFTPTPYKFSIIYATANSSNVDMYYYVPLALGFGTIISRSFFNLAAAGRFGKISSFTLHKVLLFGSLVGNLLLAFGDSSSMSVVLSSLFVCALFNNFLPILILRTIDILGHRDHHSNTGVQFFAMGLAYCLGGFFGGLVYDYAPIEYVFVASAVSFLAAIVFDEIFFFEASIVKYVVSWVKK